MMQATLDRYNLQLQTALNGDSIALRIRRDVALQALAFDRRADLLPRLLGAAASGVMPASLVESTIETTAELRTALIDFNQSQAGDVQIGDVAGRDIVTINVYVGGQDGTGKV